MNHLKFCGCRACRQGMHRGDVVRRTTRRFRRLTRLALRKGEEPPAKLSVPYTD